jgi:hypothetical protein
MELLARFLRADPGELRWQFEVPGQFNARHMDLAVAGLVAAGFIASKRSTSHYNESTWYIDVERPPRAAVITAPRFGLTIEELDRAIEQEAAQLCKELEQAMRRTPGERYWRIEVTRSVPITVVQLAAEAIRRAGYTVKAGHEQVEYNQSSLFFNISRPSI